MTFDTREVAKRIRSGRIAKNMTQMQLADEMGVSYQAVSNWERGNSMPDISKLGDLCEVLDMSVDELLGGEMAGVIRKAERKEKQAPAPGDAEGNPGPEGEAEEPRDPEDRGLSPEELAAVAPLLLPGDILRLAGETEKEEGETDWDMLLMLAPFLDEEALDELIGETEDVKTDMSHIVALAPFLGEKTLNRLALKAVDEDVPELVGLAPFLSSDKLKELVRRAMGRSRK